MRIHYLAAAFLAVLPLLACGASSDEPSSDESDLTRGIQVVFSPSESAETSHLARIAALIDGAKQSVDIAMYSYSDAKISASLDAATKRGVKVRFVYETAGEDKSLKDDALASSKSGQLEQRGVDVRYVNKIMHHKFMIVDGPRTSAANAKTARITTGSANWSASAATRFDENTLIVNGAPELAMRLQREFNTLWEHSADFVSKPFEYELSKLPIDDAAIPDDPSFDAFFTSSNFEPKGTTFKANGKNTIADALVAAIVGAKKSIHIASGHLRSRPVAEALMARAKETPRIDIRVYLDDQEYMSRSAHERQVAKLNSCIAAAGASEAKVRDCKDNGFLFGYQVGLAGADVKYKFYAYRWDNSYAPQMHHKYMVVDGETLFTGSYNLSDNAEHQTFENMLVFRAPKYKTLVLSYERNFESIWKTGEAEGRLAALIKTLETEKTVPIVFDPIALSWEQVVDLKDRIYSACPDVDLPEYRSNAARHQTCTKH